MEKWTARVRETMLKNIHEVEKILGYQFKDPNLLVEALTHSSYPSCGPTYERLEFIGDAALTAAISCYLYLTNCHVGPGRLSALRAGNISTEKLARIAIRHNLYNFLFRESPSLDAMVRDFALAVKAEEDEVMADGDVAAIIIPAVYGGNSLRAPKVLADVVESIIGAVFVDCNFNLERLWVSIRGMLEPIITEENHHDQPVSMLYEICQKNGKVIELKNWVKGNRNVMNVFVDGKLLGIGASEQKNIAKLNAARDALPKLLAELETELAIRNDCGSSSSNSNNMASDATTNTTMVPNVEREREGKKILHELCDKKRWHKPIYRVEAEEGPGHEKKFRCSVEVETLWGVFVESGDFKSRVKDAESSAACRLLAKLQSTIQMLGMPF